MLQLGGGRREGVLGVMWKAPPRSCWHAAAVTHSWCHCQLWKALARVQLQHANQQMTASCPMLANVKEAPRLAKCCCCNASETKGVWALLLCAVLAISCFRSFARGAGGTRRRGLGALPTKFGLLPLDDLTTTDQGGPYFQAEVQATIAAKAGSQTIFDSDVLNFLANTECLEARFDTFAAFGQDIPLDLLSFNGTGFGEAIGGRKASLSNQPQPWAEEVALDEQGGCSVPCPITDIDFAFTKFFDAAVGNVSNPRFDCYKDDIRFLMCTWLVEGNGTRLATGDKGCILLMSNPGLADAVSGLACPASYQSAVDRQLLWDRHNYTIEEYGLRVFEVVQAASNLRNSRDGPINDDQGLYNCDTNFIAVPTLKINNVPTDIRGLTCSRTPKQS
eukprot:jgi/Chlat1/6906/Chrsp52S06634